MRALLHSAAASTATKIVFFIGFLLVVIDGHLGYGAVLVELLTRASSPSFQSPAGRLLPAGPCNGRVRFSRPAVSGPIRLSGREALTRSSFSRSYCVPCAAEEVHVDLVCTGPRGTTVSPRRAGPRRAVRERAAADAAAR